MSKRVIQIFDIPLPNFKQFESGSRFSAQVTLRFTPQPGQKVVLHCERQRPPNRTPHPIDTTVKHAISLDTILASKDFYDITFRM